MRAEELESEELISLFNLSFHTESVREAQQLPTKLAE